MNTIPKTFYERILYILKIKQIALVTFYQDLHLAKSTVQYWKKDNIPSGETVIILAEYLDVLPEWLIFGKTDCNSSSNTAQSIIVSKIYNQLQYLTGINDTSDELFYKPLDNEEYSIKLFFWKEGYQRIDLESLIDISEKINISLDKLIANRIPKDVNEKRNYARNEQEDYLLKYNRLLSPSGRKNVYEHNYATFIKEQYDKHIKEKDNPMFSQNWDPFEDPNFDENAFV